jgi:hypothetical protein
VEQGVEVALVVQHQTQVNLGLGLEVLVDGAFADSDRIGDHLDSYAVFTLFKEELERGIENFLFATTEFTDFARFFVHKVTTG